MRLILPKHSRHLNSIETRARRHGRESKNKMSALITNVEDALAVAAMRALQERGMAGGLEGLRLLKRERCGKSSRTPEE
jgi:hypothetical protein